MLTHPFGQSKYNINELRIENLTGYAYKFSLLLSITEKGEIAGHKKAETTSRYTYSGNW